MERDKARIKPFCDQLAQLWENRCPDLRFGQIVSLLPAALRRSGRDPFCAEDEEMLEALGRNGMRQFGGNPTSGADRTVGVIDTKRRGWGFPDRGVSLSFPGHLADPAGDRDRLEYAPESRGAGGFAGEIHRAERLPPPHPALGVRRLRQVCGGVAPGPDRPPCGPARAGIFMPAACRWSPTPTGRCFSPRKPLRRPLPIWPRSTGGRTTTAATISTSRKSSPSLTRKRSEFAIWGCLFPGPCGPYGLLLQSRDFPRR